MSEDYSSQRDKSRDEITPMRSGEAPSRQRAPSSSRRKIPSLFWPIALIGFGVLLLLSNMGLIPATGWAVLWRFWPIALIALGLDVLIGRRSVAGAIASGVLILALVGFAIGIAVFAEQIPLLVDLARAPVLQSERVEHPLDGIESADIDIDYNYLPAEIYALEDSGNLIEADVAYRGDLVFDITTINSRANVTLDTYQTGITYGTPGSNRESAVWRVGLSPRVPLSLVLDTSSGSADLDLQDLTITDFELDAGSGRVELHFPETSSFEGRIDAGSGSMVIDLPPNVGLRLELDDGSGQFNPGERLSFVSGDLDDDSLWETGGYEDAEFRIHLRLDQGSGGVTIK